MAVKKRCPFCNKRLRPDGTCQTKTCPLYVPEPQPTEGNTTTEAPSTGEPVQSESKAGTEATKAETK